MKLFLGFIVIWPIGLRWISVPPQGMGVGFLLRFGLDWLVEEALTEWCLKKNIVGCLLI
jgi:hypothetical protein